MVGALHQRAVGKPVALPFIHPPTFMDTYSKPTLVLGSGNVEMPMTCLQPSSSCITNGHGPGLCPYLPS